MYSTKGKSVARVLIADDDPVIRHWLTSILQRDGYQVVSMSDGRDAYRVLQSDADFTGAVFDLAMPYLEGPDLIRYMRSEKRLMRIPVMMITAEQEIAQVVKGLAAGATILLPKPFTRRRLQQTLRLMLSHEHAVPLVKATSLPTATRVKALAAAGDEMKCEPPAQRAVTEIEAEDPSLRPKPQVDLAVLSGLEDADEGSSLIVELIDLYHENGTRQIDEIKAAAAKMDGESLKQSAHALKGSSLTMGASQVADLCQQLETPQRTDSNITFQLAGKLETAFASATHIFAVERQRRLIPAFA